MNKNLGLILVSVFILSSLGIIPGLITTQAATSSSSSMYTLPPVTSLFNTSIETINLFFIPTFNASVAANINAFDYGAAVNYTVNDTTFKIVFPNGTSLPLNLESLVKNYGINKVFYYDPHYNAIVVVLNTSGGINSPYAAPKGGNLQEFVYQYEVSTGLSSSQATYKIYNYANDSLAVNQNMFELSLPFLIHEVDPYYTYSNLSKLPAGTQLIFSYGGYTYTVTVSPQVKLTGTLVNPLYYSNSKALPGPTYAVGRSNITVAVFDQYLSTTSAPFDFNLTYASQTPAIIDWFVLLNISKYSSGANVSANFQSPVFSIYNTSNNSIVYKTASLPVVLQFNGALNVTAIENNVELTEQPGSYIYTSQNLNVTPPGNYYFSGKLPIVFTGFVYNNGSATLTANIFNGSIFYFFPSPGSYGNFSFLITPIVPMNLTTNVMSPNTAKVIYNGKSLFVGFPEVAIMFNISARFFTQETSTGHMSYVLYANVTEIPLNLTKLPTFPYEPYTGPQYTYQQFKGYILQHLSTEAIETIFNFGESSTTITGTSLTFTVLQPLLFVVNKLGYIYMVITHVWGPSTTVSVTGKDEQGFPVSLGTFRAYIALPSYYSLPTTPISGLTCDNMYTLAQVSDTGAVLETSTANSQWNNATYTGPWDLISIPSYLQAGLHIAIYNGTKLVKNELVGMLPNITTSTTFTVTLNGQTVAITYTNAPIAVYPVAFKFEPGFSYGVTVNTLFNTTPYTPVITVYMPLNYILKTKIVMWYVSPDFASYYYYNLTGQYHTSNVTLTFANVTPALIMPQIFFVNKLYMPFGIYDPYYVFFNGITIGPQSGILEAVENGFNIGNITSITVQLNGMNESIILSPANVTKLLISTTLGEVSQCSPLFEATVFNISALASLLGLPNTAALNGSYLYITYHDAISGAYVTNKTELLVGGFYVMPPTTPGSVEWILTAKYINATTGIPVEISYAVVQQPSVKVFDINAANASITSIPVTQVEIVSKYATVQVMYNPSNASTIVYMNGKFVTSYGGNLISSIPETATTGVYYGPVVNLYVATGTLSSPNGTMYVVLGSHKVAVGTANLYTYAGYHFGPYTASPVSSNVTFTVQDPVTHATLTGTTQLGAFNNTPIRISPLGVSIPATAQNKVFYYYSKPLVLSPTSQYIVLSVTSTITYAYPFYIETISFLGYNVTTGTPVPGTPAFQTVYSPSLGPGVVLQVPVQAYQFISLSTPSEPHTVVMVAVPFAGGPAISLYPTFLVYSNVTAISS
ncbi:glycosylated S-layer protein, SlaA [Sulfolobus tengchongensis]|uniref:Glycosylated S-layer protein, SlaA n=1 Tax=Sulfolobus tengchongensis TaxID=207809 RepID=A0AAX4KYZ2_9CREN